jgi:hypothetical protein
VILWQAVIDNNLAHLRVKSGRMESALQENKNSLLQVLEGPGQTWQLVTLIQFPSPLEEESRNLQDLTFMTAIEPGRRSESLVHWWIRMQK